jgi:hypothetical protein
VTTSLPNGRIVTALSWSALSSLSGDAIRPAWSP